jgi:DNA polymerase-4
MDVLVPELLEEVCAKASDRRIHKAFVKIIFADFSHTTREGIHPNPTHETFLPLLDDARKRSRQGIRLLGAGVRFAEESGEFEDTQQWLDF